MRKLLMVAYHFPPLAGSSGIQRTLRFVQQLPEYGWQPIVLTADPRAYEQTSMDLLAEVPEQTVVHRTFALDTARHLSVAGRYPGFLSRPDRWMTWQVAAVPAGMRLIEQYRPDAIWSTYPIATAHVIADKLSRRTSLPWLADFRDPMAQEGYPADPKTWHVYKHIEETTMCKARIAFFTTPGAAQLYRQRYPDAQAHITVLENGYDEETFVRAEANLSDPQPLNPGQFTLLHSGIVYPNERDPTHLLQGLAALCASQPDIAARLRLRFRAAIHDTWLLEQAGRFGVTHLLECLPPIPYRQALEEMLRADALLILQAANCNAQIPAKLYEYVRAGRPIVALTDPAGDTAHALVRAGVSSIAPLDDADAISTLLGKTMKVGADTPNKESVRNYSRRSRTAELASKLNEVLAIGR